MARSLQTSTSAINAMSQALAGSYSGYRKSKDTRIPESIIECIETEQENRADAKQGLLDLLNEHNNDLIENLERKGKVIQKLKDKVARLESYSNDIKRILDRC